MTDRSPESGATPRSSANALPAGFEAAVGADGFAAQIEDVHHAEVPADPDFVADVFGRDFVIGARELSLWTPEFFTQWIQRIPIKAAPPIENR